VRIPRLLRFAGVSGLGLCLDYALYAALYEAGLPAGWANLISAGTAVSFVYVASVRGVFASRRDDIHRLFVAYAGYQVAAVGLASVAVDLMTSLLDGRYIAAKTVVLPASFTANYLFMGWLLGDRDRQAVSS